jgi:hypothetical protein
MKTWNILGRVIDRKTGIGISGLRVEAWDKDLICDDLVDSAVTDEQGTFQISFNESYFRELFLDRSPDLFFKIFQENNLIESTENSVLWNIKSGENQMVMEVDKPSTKKLNLSEPVRITLPAKVAYNLEALQSSIVEVMERLGCPECFSGANCLFSLEREFVINPEAKVEPYNRSMSLRFQDPTPQPIASVNAVLDAKVSHDIGQVKEAVARIVDRLGCTPCHSGFDIAFRNELDLITVDKEMDVQKFGRL